MCVRCGALIKAIDAYIAKADGDLAATLGDEGYIEPQETVDYISTLEDSVAAALISETDYIIKAVEKADSLAAFQMDIWPKLKEGDALQTDLQAIFEEQFGEIVREFAGLYFSAIENGGGGQVTKASIEFVRVSKQTTAWVENWSQELASIMQLDSHKEIESILTKGLEDGIGIPQFARNIMDSGIRDEWYKARRVAVTEVLTAHRAGQQEAYLQSPSTSMKMWRHTGIYINNPRQNHKDMDGRKVPKDQPFELLGADGHYYHPMYPGDPSLPPGERIECHCTTQGIVDKDVLGLSLEERKRLQQEAIDELDDKWEKDLEDRNKALAGFTDVPTGTKNNPLQDRRQQAIAKIRGKKIWQGLPEEQRDAIVDALRDGDPDFIDMAERCMDGCSVSWELETKGTSYYTTGTGRITMHAEKHEGALHQTFWHEYGHYLDDAEISGSGVSYTVTSTDRHGNITGTWTRRGATNVSLKIGYEDAMAKDISSLLDDLGLSDRYYVHMPEDEYSHPWLYNKLTDTPISTFDNPDFDDMSVLEKALRSKFETISGLAQAKNYVYEQGFPRMPKREDFFKSYFTPKRHLYREKPAFKGADAAYKAAMDEYYAAEDEFNATHDTVALFARQDELIAQAEQIMEKLGAVSDTLDGSVYGAFWSVLQLGGHDASYYALNSKNVMEGVANVFMAQATGDQDIINCFKQICPELYDVMSRGWLTHE